MEWFYTVLLKYDFYPLFLFDFSVKKRKSGIFYCMFSLCFVMHIQVTQHENTKKSYIRKTKKIFCQNFLWNMCYLDP
jgi:hypothetical protein